MNKKQRKAQKELFWVQMDWLNNRTFENGYDYFVTMARVGTCSIDYMARHLDKLLLLITTRDQHIMYTILKGWLDNERSLIS